MARHQEKIPGETELLKLGEETVVQWLKEPVAKVWDSEVVPLDLLKQLTAPVHKKGTFDSCDNFHGIPLLGKFCKALQRRLAQRAELLLCENQCGFCSGNGCVDQVFTLRVLAEEEREFNTPLYLCFVDLKTAYDLVIQEALWSVLRRRYTCQISCSTDTAQGNQRNSMII